MRSIRRIYERRQNGRALAHNRRNEVKTIENALFHRRWNKNTIKGAEATILLDMISVLHKKSKHSRAGKITIGIDNRKACNGLVKETHKASIFSQDAGAEITQIRKLACEIKHDVEFKLAKINKK